MFYNVIKKKSITGIMRTCSDPNKSMQDGLKIPFLCEKCEELFSKYETYFSKHIYTNTVKNDGEISFNSRDDNIAYFLLSIAWRNIKHIMESNEINFTDNEKEKINTVIEEWRKYLYAENMDEIRKIQQFIIPTKNLIFFNNLDWRTHDNVAMDFRAFDEEDTFEFAISFVQVPYFIFITTVWGETNAMKQYRLGCKIKPRTSELPQNITNLLYNNHYTQFLEASNNMTEKQKKTIEDRVNSKLSKSDFSKQ